MVMRRRVKYHVFLDRRQIFFAAFVAMLVIAAISELTAPSGVGLLWLVWIAMTLFLLTFTLILPCLYIMSDQGITIVYMLGFLRRYIPWNTVRKLEVCYPKRCKSLPYVTDTFAIHGQAQGKQFIFTDNEIVRTRRARKLLERYTGHPVEGFRIDSLRTRRKKRKEKQEIDRRRQERQARVERSREAKRSEKR